MTYYTHVTDVQAPVAVYDATHAELLRRTSGRIEGLVVHVAHATDAGFRVIEVWTDRAAFERAEREIVTPILLAQLEQLGPEARAELPRPTVAEYPARGLVLPSCGIAV